MVITVTLNPAMDRTLTIDNFDIGKVNRANTVRYDVGGKGINVSKVLKNFGIESICMGFLGGIWEEAIKKELKCRNIKEAFISIKGSTRTNTKIVDNINKVYTDINEPGPIISQYELDSFIKQFEEHCNFGDIVVLSGGVSSSIPENIYGVLTKIAKRKGTIVILDAEDVLLQEGIKEKPDIIKPNDHEIAKLFGIDSSNSEQINEAVKQLRNKGIKKVMVSLGENGATYTTEKGNYYIKGLRVSVRSTVGAGDSMVAAIVYSILNNYDDSKTLRFANASGAASVSLEGTEACTLEQVSQMINNI